MFGMRFRTRFAQVRRERITHCMSSSVAARLSYICRGRSANPVLAAGERLVLIIAIGALPRRVGYPSWQLLAATDATSVKFTGGCRRVPGLLLLRLYPI
jgi:hypothetical protein